MSPSRFVKSDSADGSPFSADASGRLLLLLPTQLKGPRANPWRVNPTDEDNDMFSILDQLEQFRQQVCPPPESCSTCLAIDIMSHDMIVERVFSPKTSRSFPRARFHIDLPGFLLLRYAVGRDNQLHTHPQCTSYTTSFFHFALRAFCPAAAHHLWGNL